MIPCLLAELWGGENDAEHLPSLSYSAAERISLSSDKKKYADFKTETMANFLTQQDIPNTVIHY